MNHVLFPFNSNHAKTILSLFILNAQEETYIWNNYTWEVALPDSGYLLVHPIRKIIVSNTHTLTGWLDREVGEEADCLILKVTPTCKTLYLGEHTYSYKRATAFVQGGNEVYSLEPSVKMTQLTNDTSSQ